VRLNHITLAVGDVESSARFYAAWGPSRSWRATRTTRGS